MSKFCIYCGFENLDEANFCGNCGKKFDINNQESSENIFLKEYDEIINSKNQEVIKSFYNTATEFIRGFLEDRYTYYDIDDLVHQYGSVACGNYFSTEIKDNYASVPEYEDFIRLTQEGFLKVEVNETENQIKYTLSDTMKKLLIMVEHGTYHGDGLLEIENDFSTIQDKYYKMSFTDILNL